MEDKDLVVTVKDFPFKVTVKYLGFQQARGLWGMKHTRKPVDTMVSQAKNLPAGQILPMVKLEINCEGLTFKELKANSKKESAMPPTKFGIDSISYGVQDLVYTRVFSIIIVTDTDLSKSIPFVCHSFVCDSRNQARQITYALAAAFQEYGKKVKEEESAGAKPKKRFAIDLRTPEEQAEDNEEETEA